MVDGGPVGSVDSTEFTACFQIVFTNLYILRLALSAGIGGLLFGYDTGVISGALLYIKEDFEEVNRKTFLQETIVAMAVAGAILGAGIGGWLNDRIGRRPTMMIADALFFVGAIVMAAAPSPGVIILGRVFIGFGVGTASMTSPLYISETAPRNIRGALGTTNGFLITFGQFAAYVVNLAFTRVRGTWRWMLGVAAIPAFVQFVLMLMLPESPRWLYRNGRTNEAEVILAKIYPDEEYKEEVKDLKMSVENEMATRGDAESESTVSKIKTAMGDKVFRRGLTAGVTVQVVQQFVGINTVMYYSPTIVQLAGYASNRTALALSLITSGINATGSILSMLFVDRYGRRRLMILSMFGVITCLLVLATVFYQSALTAPKISHTDSLHFGRNSSCPAYLSAPDSGGWNCMKCLATESTCAFCAAPGDETMPGACVSQTNDMKNACGAKRRTYFTQGCPSKVGFLAIIVLGAYILSHSMGMGPVPWLFNSEIYPLKYRGVGGGFAAASNWTANLIISETFLTMTERLGTAGTFYLFAVFAVTGLVAIFFLVPETKGLSFEQVEQMLEKGFKPSLCGGKDKTYGADEEEEGR